MKTSLVVIVFAVSISICKPQNGTITDASFKAYFVGNTYINTNGNTQMQILESEANADDMLIKDLWIGNLTGSEAFKNIKVLWCDSSLLPTLDVSKNIALRSLECYSNH